MAYRKKTIDDVIRFIEINAPTEGTRAKQRSFVGKKFHRTLVDGAIHVLQEQGKFLDLEPYDLAGTNGLWSDGDHKDFALGRRATKDFLKSLQERAPEKTLTDLISGFTVEEVRTVPINQYGTTLSGMLGILHGGSSYAALRDLFDADDAFADYRDLKPYDMIHAPLYTWRSRDGVVNYELAREATRSLMVTLRKAHPGKQFTQVWSLLTAEDFFHRPINKYGTTLGGMLASVYESSPYLAVRDLFNGDESFAEFRDLQPYDLKQAPAYTWQHKNGAKNLVLARQATNLVLNELQRNQPDRSFLDVLANVTKNDFETVPINRYGTTFRGMLISVYDNSPYAALRDLIDSDEKFAEFRDFQPYDMSQAPQNTWKNGDGTKNYSLAREATGRLLERLQQEQPQKTLAQLIASVTKETFNLTINKYRTTLGGMLEHAYNCSPYHALKDLAENNSDYAQFLPVIEKKTHKTKGAL